MRRLAAARLLKALACDEAGATAIEYGLLVAGIAVAIIVALTAVGQNLQVPLNAISSKLGQ